MMKNNAKSEFANGEQGLLRCRETVLLREATAPTEETWRAALREGPGEAPGPAGRKLLAGLRRLWRRCEEEEMKRPYTGRLSDAFATRPMATMWSWWPEWRGGDQGPDEISIGHWRGLHEAAVHMQVALEGEPDGRNVYPAAIQMAATLLPALFHATALGDRHAFALALETLDAFRESDGNDDDVSVAWCGAPGLIRHPDPDPWSGDKMNRKDFWEIREIAVARLLQLGIRAGIGVAAWEAGRRLWGGGIPIADAERLGFRRRRKGERPVRNPDPVLLMRAAEMGCVAAMPAADTLREQWRLGRSPGSEETAFLSPAERHRRRMRLLVRAWRAIGPLGRGSSLSPAAEKWARTEGGETAADEFVVRCRTGEPLALASLARAVLGKDWRGDAYGPWRPAPDAPSIEDVPMFAEGVFRAISANGGAWGCFYLGQMAWKRAFDRFEAARARRGAPEDRLRFLDRDLRFLDQKCEAADVWFRRGAALGGPGAEECSRTLAWREAAR